MFVWIRLENLADAKHMNFQIEGKILLQCCKEYNYYNYQVTAGVRRNPSTPEFSGAQYSKVISELFPLYEDIGLGVSASDFDGVSTALIQYICYKLL